MGPQIWANCQTLYEATKGPNMEPIIWEKECDQAFNKIKQALVESPGLGIPNLNTPFSPYRAENWRIALGVLVQQLGNEPQPVAYLSKKLDTVATG